MNLAVQDTYQAHANDLKEMSIKYAEQCQRVADSLKIIDLQFVPGEGFFFNGSRNDHYYNMVPEIREQLEKWTGELFDVLNDPRMHALTRELRDFKKRVADGENVELIINGKE